MKVPNQLNTDKTKALIQEAIITAGKNLDMVLTDIQVAFPPLQGDTDPIKAKVHWMAKLSGMPEGWQGRLEVGGRLFWNTKPEDFVITQSMKRSVSFAILVGMLPERGFVYGALDAYRFDQQYLLVGAYKNECLHLLEKSIKYEEVKGGKGKVSMPSLGKVQDVIVESIKKNSVEFLKDIYAKMRADLERPEPPKTA